MKILTIFQENELGLLLQFFVESHFKAQVQVLKNNEEAIGLLDQDPNSWNLIVCDYTDSAKTLVPLSLKRELKTQFLFRVQKAQVDAFNAKTKQGFYFSDHHGLLTRLNDLLSENQIPKRDSDYVQANSEFLIHLSPVQADIYAQLSNQKLVKILRAGQRFSNEDVDFFQNKKKIDRLWVSRGAVSLISDGVLGKFSPPEAQVNRSKSKGLSGSPPNQDPQPQTAMHQGQEASETTSVVASVQLDPSLSLEQETRQAIAAQLRVEAKITAELKEEAESKRRAEVEAQQKTEVLARLRSEIQSRPPKARLPTPEKKMLLDLDSMQKMIAVSGMTPEVQEVAKRNVTQVVQHVRKAPRLNDLLRHLQQGQESYLASHSMLLSFLSCAVATQMEWSSDTTYQKLVLSSFLHDVAMQDEDLARIKSLSQIAEFEHQNDVKKTNEMFRTVRDHPLKGADLARAFHEVPPDVDLIIAQHHELPDGSGFPKGLTSTRIGPLPSIFILVHDWVDFILERKTTDSVAMLNFSDSIPDFVAARKALYSTGNFRKVLSCLHKIKV